MSTDIEEKLAPPIAQKDTTARATGRQLLKRWRTEAGDGSEYTGKETVAPDFILVRGLRREWWALSERKKPAIDSVYVQRPG